MRKFLPYILIFTILVGLFSPIVRVEALTQVQIDAANKAIFDKEQAKRAADPAYAAEADRKAAAKQETIDAANKAIFDKEQAKRAAVPCTAPNTPVGCTAPSDAPAAKNINYQLLAPLPDPNNPNELIKTFDTTGGLGKYLNQMIKIFIGLCAVLSVVMIVVGGLEYMTSELPGNKGDGKEKILHALFGLLIALGAYALLSTINPDLLKSDINPPDVTVTMPATATSPVIPPATTPSLQPVVPPPIIP